MCKQPIKITRADKFVWLVVTEKAKEVFNSGLFTLYALHDDDSESLISEFEELNECLERGIDIGIEVGFTNYKEVEQLEKALKSHDFYYEMSDDHRYYQAGHESLKRILELKTCVDEETYVSLWNKYAPKGLKFR